MTEEMTIGEIARHAGMRPSALRYYEEIGVLIPARRVSGQRRYRAEALHQLTLIRFAQQIGFSLDEIRLLLDGFPTPTASTTPSPATRWQTLVPPKLAEIDALISRAQQIKAMLEQTRRCQCASMEECAEMVISLGDPPTP